MEPIITIKDQEFYYADVAELVEFSVNNKCAVIIDEKKLKEFFDSTVQVGSNQVSQLIVISESLNSILPEVQQNDVFIMSADSFEQAVRFAVFSAELNDKVVCVTDVDSIKFKETIEQVME